MTSDMQSVVAFAHGANISRYWILLKTDLTANDRQFIERRLGEEHEALLQVVQGDTQREWSDVERPQPFDATQI